MLLPFPIIFSLVSITLVIYSKAFDLPPTIKPICLLPVGYAAEDSVPYAPWHDVYRPVESFCEEL